MSTNIAHDETTEKILRPVRVGVLKGIAFILEFLLHLREKFFGDDGRVKTEDGDRLSRTSGLGAIVIQDANIRPVPECACDKGGSEYK